MKIAKPADQPQGSHSEPASDPAPCTQFPYGLTVAELSKHMRRLRAENWQDWELRKLFGRAA